MVINYSLLDIQYSDIENKQTIEEDNAKLHETVCPILNPDISTEQADALRFLNAKIDQIFSENFVNDNKFEMMPAQLYKHSVGLCGRGGVGKTHLLVDLINYWVNDEQKRVCYVAHTHNAVNIMKNMLITKKIDQSRALKVMTFSKLIRRNVCENGKLLLANESDYLNSNFELIGYFDLIIVDESSMIRVQDLLDIMRRLAEEKKHDIINQQFFPCFLFTGDYRQLGPIDENYMPANCWNNVISHVIFSNKLKSRELNTIMRSSDLHIQSLCDSVGNELEKNFFNLNTQNFSLNNYTISKAAQSESIKILKNVQIGIQTYSDMLVDHHLNSVWLHVNNSMHKNTIDLTKQIRQTYYSKLMNNFDGQIKDYFIGDIFMYTNNYLFDQNLDKQLVSKNPYTSINLPEYIQTDSFQKGDFLNSNYFEITTNRNCFRLNESNLVANERFKIVHIQESKIKTSALLLNYGKKFFAAICVDPAHEIKLENLFLISSCKPENMCMVLNKIDLEINYGTYCCKSKSQLNISISHQNVKIWYMESCSYKDYKSTYGPILKTLDFKKIFPISYVCSIQTFQGSTIENVFVGEYNLKEAKHLSSMGFFTNLYTALSRAKKRIYIVE